ncbi:mechanosensitive ion channel family protein [Metabacillus sediminilitoris]|uniref:Mechanosensitive ion channel family protein n=1 Tax=Metabacillus sediminilitoris TaxID=2567941 RepID=A0A4S4BI05_9BACI|nr:mechanosensitive ion channel domain-containing protein [Metabacillus sediminilitoris]QGQ44851.1 mechanosensitive ion channel [Metabacillus sediminilitoris]THF73593.1 mechanosensitive ion channel family protein [Metabacillus sediminilitoris]
MDFLGLFKQLPVQILTVALLIIITVYLIRKSIKLFFDKTSILDEKREETLMHFSNQVTKVLGLVIFFIFVLSNFFDLTKLVTGSVVLASALALILQHIIRDYIMGLTYLFERQIHHGDYVIINGNRQGKIEEISMRHLKIRQYDGYLYTVSYSNITELQNGNRGMRRVNESLVLNYRQNPDDAYKVIEEVANTCNEKYGEYLLKDENGVPVESFKFNQITELNVDFRGHRYSLTGVVKEADFVEVGKKVRYELAIAAYKNDLMMAESGGLESQQGL